MELQNYRGYCDETKDDTGTSTVEWSMRVTKRKTLRVGKRMMAIIVLRQHNVMNDENDNGSRQIHWNPQSKKR